MRQFAQLLSLHSCSLLQASTAYRCYSVPTAKRLRLLLLGQARELGGLYLLALALLALLPLSLDSFGCLSVSSRASSSVETSISWQRAGGIGCWLCARRQCVGML